MSRFLPISESLEYKVQPYPLPKPYPPYIPDESEPFPNRRPRPAPYEAHCDDLPRSKPTHDERGQELCPSCHGKRERNGVDCTTCGGSGFKL